MESEVLLKSDFFSHSVPGLFQCGGALRTYDEKDPLNPWRSETNLNSNNKEALRS